MDSKKMFETLKYFKPYLTRTSVESQLKQMVIYPEFKRVYEQNRQEDENLDVLSNICKTLVYGVENNLLTEEKLDELLFRLIEDKLLLSFLYRLDGQDFLPEDTNALPSVLTKWGFPKSNKILKGITLNPGTENFVPCGYRTNDSDSIRILIMDKKLTEVKEKDKEAYNTVFTTLIEFDFRRKLLHIRLRDIDNITNSDRDVSTMEGRINRTLRYIESLAPSISFRKITSFRESLFKLEENILIPKRLEADKKIDSFRVEIENFTSLIDSKFNPSHENDVTTADYISNTLLALISSSLDLSTIGDVVGIKFRNRREEDESSFAEVSISDKGFKCISTDKLYWSNLSTLLEQGKIEFLKISTVLPSGFVDANLEVRLETATVKLNQNSKGKPEEGKKQPTDEKYYDFIEYLLPFISENN
ncbi:hypothetical protein [Paenibacillus sp. FSL R5-808]|jgi:hypothetical protein|uniref:hypothetical protein n=1 Tax=Paenibacillus sp. FSL R5-808 TaxID=1227076 RepID=UPI0003E2A544|nr:hypothetical protein [Paenibacillus sp. FSL R5-808]ETT33285.1 hypothetical protein C169_22855 [Paenibacillus sp. FSL R5-808]